MDESKALLYCGRETNGDWMPRVKFEDIPKERQEKWLSHLATFSGVVSNDEEFEEWLAAYLHRFYSDGNYEQYCKGISKKRRDSKEDFEYMMRSSLEFHRAEYEHIKDFQTWRVKNLDPQIEELADIAAHAPQYSWESLYALERQKILCMRTYFSHSRISDSKGHFRGEMWMDICLNLLGHIVEEGMHIPYESIKKMNLRNVRDIVPQDYITDYLESPEPDPDADTFLYKEFYGKKIYVRKMERLYHLIRLYKTRDWWE